MTPEEAERVYCEHLNLKIRSAVMVGNFIQLIGDEDGELFTFVTKRDIRGNDCDNRNVNTPQKAPNSNSIRSRD